MMLRDLNWQNITATRIDVAAFAILCGCTGIIAGFYEVSQGNVAPDSLIISTVGPEYGMWKTYGLSELMETYSALTVIPNFLVTGILAIIVSCLVIIWGVGFVHSKRGEIIFLLLSIFQLLVGGGFVMDLALITTVTATRINKPLTWWKNNLPIKIRGLLAKLWIWSLIAFSLISASMLGITIVGVNDVSFQGLLRVLAALMFVPLILIIIGGFAYDIQKRELENKSLFI
jgi:hypothetical protein